MTISYRKAESFCQWKLAPYFRLISWVMPEALYCLTDIHLRCLNVSLFTYFSPFLSVFIWCQTEKTGYGLLSMPVCPGPPSLMNAPGHGELCKEVILSHFLLSWSMDLEKLGVFLESWGPRQRGGWKVPWQPFLRRELWSVWVNSVSLTLSMFSTEH